ncbi:hypothetical protein SpCBS45565_g04714 [Spizellomyces sp. 'palustris']|nr:hypothetical protein SpCBS45565_g04714 [Spizellomyces sp. 'palustris']
MNSQRGVTGNFTIRNLFGTDSDTETDDSITSESELEDRTTDDDSMDAHGDTGLSAGFSGEHTWEGGARTSTSASTMAMTSVLQEAVEDAETLAHQQDLRKRIMAIQSNDGFSAMEKAKKIQVNIR